MTGIAEPIASLEYGKAIIKSGIKLWDWSWDVIGSLVNYIKEQTAKEVSHDSGNVTGQP